jgi:DNA-binding IscR family transcriptional regulator
MAEASGVLTSEQLAQQLGSNAAVVRRMMAGLREAGLVRSDKGHGGGWTLQKPLTEVTLGAVYAALGAPTIFAMGHRTESPGCLVEQAVNRVMSGALDEAEAILVARLRSVSLAEIAADVARSIPTRTRPTRPTRPTAPATRGGTPRTRRGQAHDA